MAAKSIHTKSRNNAVAPPLSGPVRATLSFGLTSKDLLQQPPLNTGGSACSEDLTNGHHQRNVRLTSCGVWRSSSDNPRILRKVKNGQSLDNGMSRSNSLDTAAISSSSFYLSGTWPRVGRVVEPIVGHSDDDDEQSHPGIITQTPTPKDWHAERHGSSHAAFVQYSSWSSPGDLKEIRARLKSTKETKSTRSSPVLPFVIGSPQHHHPSTHPSLSNARIHHHHRRRHHHAKHRSSQHCRGSLEGLNQELETLNVMNSSAAEFNRHDGRRAPVADLLTCDQFKQLPVAIPIEDCSVLDVDDPCLKSTDSGFGSTMSSMDLTSLSSAVEESHTSSYLSAGNECTHLIDEYGVSPPKFILTRLPPEGCENITCKLNETSSRCVQMETTKVVVNSSKIINPSFSNKCHIPSEVSAFCTPPLLQKYMSQTSGMLSSTSSAATAGKD